MSEYPVKEGDPVYHIKDLSLIGIVTHVDKNIAHPTTCNVLWNGEREEDIMWTNKIIKMN
jgi:hypothetical protein